jgi:hypothetical protein
MRSVPVSDDAAAIDIRLALAPEWPKADAVAMVAKAATAAAFAQRDVSDMVGIVACELMENAIKYGDWSGPAKVMFSFRSDGDYLAIEVACPCDQASPHYERLSAALRLIEKANARDSYLERLAQIARDSNERGGLGLLRLAHEAKCRLSARLADNDLLHVQARLPLPR